MVSLLESSSKMARKNELAASYPYPYPYKIGEQTKLMVNSEILSDVSFLVGPKKRKFFSHKLLLSLGSPVFFAMFNGDLRPSSNQPIEVPDLEENGFLNMLR